MGNLSTQVAHSYALLIQIIMSMRKLNTKIRCPRAKRTNRVSIPSLLGTIYIAAKRSVLASVPLTAITEAIQEIEMLRKDRRTNQTAAQGREW